MTRPVTITDLDRGLTIEGQIVADAPFSVAVHWAEADGTGRTAWFHKQTRRRHGDGEKSGLHLADEPLPPAAT